MTDLVPREKKTWVSIACFKGPNLKKIPSCRAPKFIQSAPKSRLRQHKSQPEVADTWLCIIHSLLSIPKMYRAGLELNGKRSSGKYITSQLPDCIVHILSQSSASNSDVISRSSPKNNCSSDICY